MMDAISQFLRAPLRSLLALLGGIAVGSGVFGCSSMRPEDFSSKEPRFVLEEYFADHVKGYGVFFDRFGDVRREFTLFVDGEETEDGIILHEDLRFHDGERITRSYVVTKVDEHRYSVEADAFDGTAQIESYGNTLKWTYALKQKIGGSVWVLHFDDWMFLREDGVVLNRAFGSKWGFDVGEVFMTLMQVPSQAEERSE